MDSGFWYASIDSSDTRYMGVAHIADNIRGLAIFSDSLATSKFLEPPNSDDYSRTAEIPRKYNDANIDFLDAWIVAIAERLNIMKILTVDRRHFKIFRPRHCVAFEICP